MSEKEEYGIEDICISLDAIEKQLKEMNRLQKIFLHQAYGYKWEELRA